MLTENSAGNKPKQLSACHNFLAGKLRMLGCIWSLRTMALNDGIEITSY